jgi:RsiW-degrading membrane proteinase PrsW (M82 family)
MSESVANGPVLSIWKRLSGPAKIGLGFALVAVLLSVFGVLRDPDTPKTLWAFVVASLIGGGTWGLVSWAIATAAVEVERDISVPSVGERGEDEEGQEQTG